eukprot:scaffold28973_cov118-Isochrysis_galbana.AAC.4
MHESEQAAAKVYGWRARRRRHTDDREAQVLEVVLSEQEDGASIDVVGEEGGHERAQTERIEPAPELFPVPHQHIALQSQHLEVGQAANRRQVLSDGLAVELKLVQVLVAPLDEATKHFQARSALATRTLRARLLLVPAEFHAHVLLPHTRALQLEVVCVLVTKLTAPALHLHARHVHLGRALVCLVLNLILKPQPRPARPAQPALELEVVQIPVLLPCPAIFDPDTRDETDRTEERLGFNRTV